MGQNDSRSRLLEAKEFIRRFLLHVLPDGFQKIRYFGLMANRIIGKISISAADSSGTLRHQHSQDRSKTGDKASSS